MALMSTAVSSPLVVKLDISLPLAASDATAATATAALSANTSSAAVALWLLGVINVAKLPITAAIKSIARQRT
jgi:hypothetical protein